MLRNFTFLLRPNKGVVALFEAPAANRVPKPVNLSGARVEVVPGVDDEVGTGARRLPVQQ